MLRAWCMVAVWRAFVHRIAGRTPATIRVRIGVVVVATRAAPWRLRGLRVCAIAAAIILIAVLLELARVVRLLHARTCAAAFAARLTGCIGEPALQHGRAEARFGIVGARLSLTVSLPLALTLAQATLALALTWTLAACLATGATTSRALLWRATLAATRTACATRAARAAGATRNARLARFRRRTAPAVVADTVECSELSRFVALGAGPGLL